jgi:cobalamin biosynthesis protein CobD/CbiB
MLPSSAIQVIEHTQSRLVILEPPEYLTGTIVLCFGLVGIAAAGAWLALSRSARVTFVLVSCFAILPFVFLGWYLLTSQTSVILSRDEGVLRIEHRSFGRLRDQQGIPLNQIQRAVVETVRYNRRVVLVLTTGQVFPLGDASNEEGYYPAADAINDFLGVQRER